MNQKIDFKQPIFSLLFPKFYWKTVIQWNKMTKILFTEWKCIYWVFHWYLFSLFRMKKLSFGLFVCVCFMKKERMKIFKKFIVNYNKIIETFTRNETIRENFCKRMKMKNLSFFILMMKFFSLKLKNRILFSFSF